MKKLSPTFLIASTVVTISLFVLLSMLFYGPSDYFEQGSAAQDDPYYGFRYTVASAFFGSFGIGAYVGWMIILAWAVIVFFRESVGDLAIRAISLAVVVVSGAALADLLGANNLGGSLGYAVGTVLRDGFGTVLGVILIGAVFSVAMVLATDFGFVSYYKEARGALAIAEEEEEEETPEAPMDLISRMEQTVNEIEAEDEAAGAFEEAFEEAAAEEEEEEAEAGEEEHAFESMTPPAAEEEEESLPDRPIVTDLRPTIEEEDLDEELATAEEPETEAPAEPLMSMAGPIIETEPLAELSLPESELPAAETAPSLDQDTVGEPVEEAGVPVESEIVEIKAEPTAVVSEPVRSAEEALESVFDALVGSPAPDPREEELMRAALVGETGVVVVEDDVLVTESTEEAQEEEPVVAEPEEAPVPQTPVLEDPIIEDPVIGETSFEEPEAAAPAVEEPPAEEPPSEEPTAEAPLVEEPEFVLDDAVYIVSETIVTEEEQEVEEPPAQAEKPAEAVEPAEPEAEAAPAEEPVILLDDEIVIDSGPDEAEDSLLPFMSEEQEEEEEEPQAVEEREDAEPAEAALPETPLPAETETAEEPVIPVLEEVPNRGMFRSLFPRKKSPLTATVADPLLDHAAEMVIERNRASVVLLQRRLDIGYTRAARIIEALETEGLVGPLTESGSREILLTAEGWRERK